MIRLTALRVLYFRGVNGTAGSVSVVGFELTCHSKATRTCIHTQVPLNHLGTPIKQKAPGLLARGFDL